MRIVFPAVATGLLMTISTQATAVNYPAWQSTIKYSRTAAGASGYGNFARATSTVVYDPIRDTYTVRDTGSLTTKSTFGPANINAGASNSTFTVYKKISGSTTETFRRLNQSASNPLIVLSYVDYGQWRRSTTSGSTTSVNDTYLVWGQRTPGASVPRTGSASYNTVLDGTFVNRNGAYAVSGTGTFGANFGAGTISYSSTATGTREGGGAGINFGTMTGAGSIAFNSAGFNGTGTTNGNGYAMDVNGNFYGPAVDEIGGVFRIRGGGGSGTGAIVGN